MPNLILLGLNQNDISGTLPSELAECTSLLELAFWNNLLTGSLPKEIYHGDYKQLSALIFDTNFLSGTISCKF